MSFDSIGFKSPLQRVLLIAPFFFWGTSMVAMKGILEQTSPLFLGAMRIMPAGVILIMAAVLLGRAQPKSWQAWLWIGAFALIDGTLFQGFLVEGLERTGAGLGSVMIDSQPLAVALLAWLLYGEQVRFWGWLGLLIGIVGISCIGIPDTLLQTWLTGNGLEFLAASPGELWSSWWSRGESWMLLAALSMAVGTVMIRGVSRHVDPVMATGWHMLLGGIPLLLASMLQEVQPWANLEVSGWLSIAYATVFGSAVAYGLFFFFASRGNLTSLSALTFLTPVFALLFGNWFLAEVLSAQQLLGVGLTLLSIYLVNQRDCLPWFNQPAQLDDETAVLPMPEKIAVLPDKSPK